MDCDTGPNTAIYWHMTGPVLREDASDPWPVVESNYVYVDYWFFYRFNKAAPTLDHEADWENVTLAYPAETAWPTVFTFAAFSAHGHLWHYLRDTISCSPNGGAEGVACISPATRPHVFVADGTHANYPQSCSAIILCPQTTAEGDTHLPPEKEYDGHARWGANDISTALKRFPEALGWSAGIAAPSWVDWFGWWGYITDTAQPADSHVESPAAPRLRDTFHRPDLELQCTERHTDSTVNCDGSEGPHAPPAHMRGSLGSQQSAESSFDCLGWQGPYVAMSLCDPEELRTALRTGTVGEPGNMSVTGLGAAHHRFAVGRGVSQLVGKSLSPGDQVVLTGEFGPTVRLMARFRDGNDVVAARFFNIGTFGAGRLVIRLRRPGDITSVVVEDPSGRLHSPSRLTREQD